MPDLTIETNSMQVADVLIRDMGLLIPGGGSNVVLSDIVDLEYARVSQDLRDLVTDDAYGTNGSTLILLDGTAEIDVNDVDSFLNGISDNGTESFQMVLGGELTVPDLPLVNFGIEISGSSFTMTEFRARRGVSGSSGTTTIQLEINGSPISGAILSWVSSDVNFSEKSVGISESISAGDRISCRLTSAEIGAEDIFAQAS